MTNNKKVYVVEFPSHFFYQYDFEFWSGMGIAVWFSYAHCIQTNLNLNAKFCFRISLCLQNSKYTVRAPS